jgi:Fur family peroxide stress response transcriptional regulator
MDQSARKERLQAFEQFCRSQGQPFTVQRRAVLEAVLERRDHPTAEQVFSSVAESVPAISRTTVYRTLETLVRTGLVDRVFHTGSVVRYDPRTEVHHHLVCQHCDEVIDISDDRLDSLPVPDGSSHGFEILDFSVQFRGTCKRCRDNKEGV